MTLRDHLTAAATLVAMLWMLLTAGPLIKPLQATWVDTPEERDRLAARHGAWVPALIGAGVWAEQNLRAPLDPWLRPTQEFLGLEQGYAVYPSTAGRVRVLELRVDGELVFRSQDPDHAWNRAALGTRKVRPLVLDLVDKGARSRNFAGVMRYLRAEVLRGYPSATTLDVVTRVGPYPGTTLRRERWFHLEAPDWKTEIRLDGRPPAGERAEPESNL